MEGGIYKITNPKGKVYIGKTKNFNKRKSWYKTWYNPSKKLQPKLFNSFEKYGFDNHIIELIDIDPLKEKHYIEKYNSFNEGLNSNKGGGGVISHSKETRKKISKMGLKNKGNRINSGGKGKPKPPGFAERMSKERKGKPNPKNNKPVLQYNKQGNFIQEHPSIEEAAKNINGNPTAINNALRKGNNATSGGYIWKYKN